MSTVNTLGEYPGSTYVWTDYNGDTVTETTVKEYEYDSKGRVKKEKVTKTIVRNPRTYVPSQPPYRVWYSGSIGDAGSTYTTN